MNPLSRRRRLAILVVGILGAACGSASPPLPAAAPDLAKPSGFATSTLARGLPAPLPGGALYANVIDLPQDGGGAITHAHVAGFVYAIAGIHSMPVDGGATVTLNPGEAGFIGAGVKHSHVNPGTATNDWYFISIRPTAARTAPNIVPGQKVLFATDDLAAFPAGAYAQQLDRVAIAAGGRGAPRMHGGIELDYVLSGSLSVHGEVGKTVSVSAGQGYLRLPGSGSQDFAGTAGAVYLAFFATAEGQPFETILAKAF